ncbi:MAG: hypothetical protein ACFFBP_20500 [Promethearchaeota archaeon]
MTRKNKIPQFKDEPITYGYLMKRSLKFTIEVVIILILLFNWVYIFNLIRVLYRF